MHQDNPAHRIEALVRPSVRRLPLYDPGADPRKLGTPTVTKLSNCENPWACRRPPPLRLRVRAGQGWSVIPTLAAGHCDC